MNEFRVAVRAVMDPVGRQVASFDAGRRPGWHLIEVAVQGCLQDTRFWSGRGWPLAFEQPGVLDLVGRVGDRASDAAAWAARSAG